MTLQTSKYASPPTKCRDAADRARREREAGATWAGAGSWGSRNGNGNAGKGHGPDSDAPAVCLGFQLDKRPRLTLAPGATWRNLSAQKAKDECHSEQYCRRAGRWGRNRGFPLLPQESGRGKDRHRCAWTPGFRVGHFKRTKEEKENKF